MKRTRWLFGAAVVAGVVVLVAPAVGQGKAAGRLPAGSLDPSFGNRGIVAHRAGGGIRGIAIQPDGKIVVVGSSLLARYLANGSPDPSFGTGGYVKTTAGDSVSAVALQPDGKIVVAGTRYVDGPPLFSEFMVARYNPNGSLDTSFGEQGVATTDVSQADPYLWTDEHADGLAIFPDGAIVVGGTTFQQDDLGSYSWFALAKYTSDGSLDPTFNPTGTCGWGSNGCKVGVVETIFHGGDELRGIAALASGEVVATGDAIGPGRDDDGHYMVLARYWRDGSLEGWFGTGGKVSTSLVPGYDGGPFALQGGKIVVAGSDGPFLLLARFKVHGDLDPSFGKHGFARIKRLPGARAVVAQPDGKILIASGKFVARLTPNGQLDESFGAGGIVPLGYPLSSLALQADGKIVVGGGNGHPWTLARLLGRAASAGRPASLGWSRSPGEGTVTSYDFGGDGGPGASGWFRLGYAGSTTSGKLKITLAGSSAFSIGSDHCTTKSIGLGRSCWVRVDYAVRAGMSDHATLRATGENGAAASLRLSGHCPAGASLGRVYWVTHSDAGTVKEALSAAGCPTTITTLASGQDYPWGPAVDGTHVYWVNSGDGTVKKVPLGGGTVSTLASGQEPPSGPAVDGTHVYWVNGNYLSGTVNKVPIGGGSVTTLAGGQTYASSVAVDGTHVYWTDEGPDWWTGGTVNEVPLGGGPVTTIATGQDFPHSVVADGTHVYWVDGMSGTVNEVPVGGGPVTVLASGQNFPVSLAVDGTHVYWVNYGTYTPYKGYESDGTVNAVPIGGGPVTTLATGQSQPQSVAADGAHVYWTNNDGTVKEVPIGGGTVHTVARGQGYSVTVAVGP